MSSKVYTGPGELIGEARAGIGLSLQETADRAGCSAAYVHKLEQGRVRTPSPRVLAGIARTLGLDYGLLMARAGYEPTGGEEADAAATPAPSGPRYSNMHIVHLLEKLAADVAEIRKELDRLLRER